MASSTWFIAGSGFSAKSRSRFSGAPTSNNTRSYWRPTGDERIGYQPRQNAEDYAAAILPQTNPLDPIAQQYQGGSFVTIDFTPIEARTRGR